PPKKRQRELVLRGVVPIQRHFRNARARGTGVHSNGANAVARKELVGGSIYALRRSDRARRGTRGASREARARPVPPATRRPRICCGTGPWPVRRRRKRLPRRLRRRLRGECVS